MTMLRAGERFAVIGNPIGHSRSPRIHALFAHGLGQSIDYVARLCPLGDFARDLERFRASGAIGANVTLPFKIDAYACATERSPRAQAAGAANFLHWRDSHWFCDNTDGAGLVRDIESNLGVALRGRSILLLGAGGAARGALLPILEREPAHLCVGNRTHATAQALIAPWREGHAIDALALDGHLSDGERFDIVINATSASLHGDLPLPATSELFAPTALAYDMMYGREPTPFMRWASARGATRVSDGLGMLVEQAAESYRLWRGVQPETAPVIAQLRSELAHG